MFCGAPSANRQRNVVKRKSCQHSPTGLICFQASAPLFLPASFSFLSAGGLRAGDLAAGRASLALSALSAPAKRHALTVTLWGKKLSHLPEALANSWSQAETETKSLSTSLNYFGHRLTSFHPLVLDLFEVLCFFGHRFEFEFVDRCPLSSSDLSLDPLDLSSRAQRVRVEAPHARHAARPVSRRAARRAARRAGLARHVASLATRAAPFVGAGSRAFATDLSRLFDLPQLCKVHIGHLSSCLYL